MTVLRFALLAAGVSALLAAPAFAAWERVGSVDVDYRLENTSQYGNFGGPVQRVQLRAAGSDVACKTINAQFGNGRTSSVWKGTLREGRPVNVDMPGKARTLQRLDFVCRATGRHGATVEIYADTQGWGPRAMGPAGRAVRPPHWNENGWIALGSARFADHDGETTVEGANGRHFRRVGLRPRGGDARCGALVIRFTSGEKVSLPVNGSAVMREGQLYSIDLPGRQRNVLRLALACRAVHADSTAIQVYAMR